MDKKDKSDAVMWIGVSAAIITAVCITKSAWPLWGFFIPLFSG